MFYDVTEQKKTQNALIAERDFALQIMNNMGQGLTVLDKNGSFEYVNPAYATMIGFHVEEILGKKPSDFSSETHKITLLDERKKRKLGLTSTYEITLLNKNGVDVPAIVTGVPRVKDNEITGTISVITDLTLQKQSERALDRQVKELRVLHAATVTGTEGASEDEIIKNLIEFLSQIYNEVCGVLLLDETGQLLVPHPSYIGANVSDWQAGTPLSQGITGQAILEGRHIRTGNIREHPNYIEIASDILSELCVPIRVNKHTIGVINVESRKPNAFNEEDERFLMTAAGTLGAALERLRLYAETQQSLREMETINRVSSSMRTTHKQGEMCNTLLDEALSILQADSGAVWLYAPLENQLIQTTSRGKASLIKNKKMDRTKGIVGHAFSTAKVYISNELATDLRVDEENRKSFPPGIGAAIIPIHSTAGTLGVLSIQIDTNRLSPEKINLLTTLSEIAGNAIHRADLYDQSQEQIRKLTTLRDIDSAINSSTDLRVTLNLLVNHALHHLKVDAVDILMYQPELQSLAYYCGTGFHSPSPFRPLTRVGEGLAGQVVTQGKVIHIPDLATSKKTIDPFLEQENIVAYVGIPVIVKGHIKGVFEIFNRSAFTISDEWMAFMMTLAGQAAIAIDNTQLFDNLQKSNDDLKRAYDTTLEGWARALELRDRETEGHTRRVTNLTMELAQYMGIFGEELENIYRGVLLHDIGKMGVPDHILRKTGPLNDDEWIEMRKHPQYAFDLLSPIQYLRPALDIPYCHHEHWDGTGYPRGLKGENIPIAARIFSVVDIWDALLSNRPYRDAWPQKKVVEYLTEISGKVLEPKIVETFIRMLTENTKRTG
jgi:PAS domain S-box-containing protein